MVAIVGLVVLMICVFGGFIIAGGSLAPIIKAAPYEMFIIGGAGIGGMITGNSGVILKGAFGGFGRVIKGPKYKKEDYLAVMLLVAKIMKTLKTEGAVALEAHIENPEASAIFGEHPPILHDHDLLDLICNTVRLMVVSSSNLSPYAVEDVMDDTTIKRTVLQIKSSKSWSCKIGGCSPKMALASGFSMCASSATAPSVLSVFMILATKSMTAK